VDWPEYFTRSAVLRAVLERKGMLMNKNQFGFAQIRSTPVASLWRAPARTPFVAKAQLHTWPWTPHVARACIPPQGATSVALMKYPG
jgi:hypothetical protein